MQKLINKYHLDLILLGLSIFIFYLVCMPKTVTLEDDGIFLLSSYFNGISHPPGYPLHSLLGYFFTHLPFGNPAANGHALSAIFSALSSILIFIITSTLITNNPLKKITPYIAAIAFSLSTDVWSQSIITEVYTLNAFLFLCVLYLTLRLHSSINLQKTIPHTQLNTSKPILFYLGLFSGLGLTNHWPLFILGCIGISFLLLDDLKYIIKHWYLFVLGLIIGLTPYIWLYINSNSNTFIQYFNPFENLREFYAFISREHFNKAIDFSPTATLWDKVQLFIFTLKQLFSQWGMLNIIFVPIGIIASFSMFKNQRKTLIGFLIIYISTSLILSLILGYDFDEKSKTNIPPFFVLAHSQGAIFFAIGVTFVINLIAKVSNKNFKFILITIVLLQAFAANIFVNYRANYNWTDLYAKHVLDTLKPNSTLFVSSDIGTGVIGYWRFVKNYRPDVKVIQSDGLVLYGTNIFNPKKVTDEEKEKIILNYAKSSPHPVYFLYQEFKFGVNSHWFVYEYNGDVKDNQSRLQSLSLENRKYLSYIFSDIHYSDNWTVVHRDYMRLQALDYLMNQLEITTNDAQRTKIIQYISMATNNLLGLNTVLTLAYEHKNIHLFSSKEEIITRGWDLYDKETDKAVKAGYLNILARINIESGDIDKGFSLYVRSANIWQQSKNIAHKKIAKLIESGIVSK